MEEIVLQHPIAEVTVFYVKEYDSIVLRQDTRKGHVDILMTIRQLQELVEKLVRIDCVKETRLTPLAVDVAEVCDCGEPFPKSGYCKFCGARERQRH